MNQKRTYLLDTSFLINGWTKRYCRTVFPTLWTRVEDEINRGTVISCHEVLREIQKGKDDLIQWAKDRKHIFHKPEADEFLKVREVMRTYPNFAATGGHPTALIRG